MNQIIFTILRLKEILMIAKNSLNKCLMMKNLEKINMSGVNSINWAKIICQIVYYFYAYFKISSKINFSVPTGNFGDVYAGYIAKKWDYL